MSDYMMVKAADTGGWIIECNHFEGQQFHPDGGHTQHIAATTDQLIDRVLKFAARTADRGSPDGIVGVRLEKAR